MTFTEWITAQYEYQVASYRMALGLEIWHTQRIYGNTLPNDVRPVLTESLRSIKPPEMDKYCGDRSGTMEIYNKLHKPNFDAILCEVMESI